VCVSQLFFLITLFVCLSCPLVMRHSQPNNELDLKICEDEASLPGTGVAPFGLGNMMTQEG
jgi:hypothetical protein